MTLLEQYRTEYINQHYQFMLFDLNGLLMESCDSLFSTKQLASKPVQTWFSFMESLFESLKVSGINKDLIFKAVKPLFSELSGIYDFRFSVLESEGRKAYRWIIIDYTSQYEEYQKLQQKYNDLKIIHENLSSEMLKLPHNSTEHQAEKKKLKHVL